MFICLATSYPSISYHGQEIKFREGAKGRELERERERAKREWGKEKEPLGKDVPKDESL